MLPETIAFGAAALVGYHHLAFPLALKAFAAAARRRKPASESTGAPSPMPRVAIVVPAHNEARVIARKVANCAALGYPRDRLEIIVACDGCSDATAELARAAARDAGAGVRVFESATNVGKVATLNRVVPEAHCDIVMLTDASAMLDAGALGQAVRHFEDKSVAVVCPTYRLGVAGSEGERAYWSYQTRIKTDEAALGAPIGAHGACYLFRRNLWAPLPADTINDDVIIPMRMVAAGHRAVYDTSIAATEIETTRHAQEWRRRIRIGAGNMQQIIRLSRLASPSRPGLAFVFLSGKALRVAVPFLAIAAFVAAAAGAAAGSTIMQAFLMIQLALLALALLPIMLRHLDWPRPVTWLGYLLEGHTASFIGAMRYLTGREGRPWRRAAQEDDGMVHSSSEKDHDPTYIPPSVRFGKRLVDIVCGLGALAVLTVLFIPIALAIKLDSRGPLFYRQQRVGRVTPTATYLFYLIKFRTMRTDAETKSGAVWASKDDPRITRVGRFMRKTRLDELPQCFNVLKGEMSVIGPRPERPGFFNKLEDAIPFYAERTYGLKPGITGLAQVNQAYDSCIEDVRNKVLYDHAYAARLTSWREWLRTDVGIIFKTVTVMALGKGQ